MALVGQASSHIPQKIQREKLIRKNSGYHRPSSLSAFCREMQPTGQDTAQRLHATQRSSPSGSRVNTIRPRYRADVGTFSSGYSSVSRLRKECIKTRYMLRNWLAKPRTMDVRVAIVDFDDGEVIALAPTD